MSQIDVFRLRAYVAELRERAGGGFTEANTWLGTIADELEARFPEILPPKPRPQGFTDHPEIRALLAPYEGTPRGGENLVRFDRLPHAALARIIELLPPEHREMQFDNSPYTEDFLALGVRFPGTTYFGHRVTPERSDERVSAEGVYIPAEHVTAEIAVELTNDLAPDECDFQGDGADRVLRLRWD